ncbi:MAG: AAA family ATPase [Syntrophobacteraceae bacterium]|nr:AAA family ATPase [Syntrophobacteraceae bacterium]
MPADRLKLKELTLKGFKSVDAAGQSITFGDVTVFLGANGAGKSNIVSFFKLLNYLTTGGLQIFIGEQGYGDSLLHYGSSTTVRVQAELRFEQAGCSEDTYSFTLSHASGDTLIFTEEYVTWRKAGYPKAQKVDLKAGHREANLIEDAKETGLTSKTSRFILNLLRSCRVYQFHDTSSTAKIRNYGYIGDGDYLRDNAGNLAAFLFAMASREEWRRYYERIVRHIQLVMPQFGDFILRPSPVNKSNIDLDWKDKGRGHHFGPHQISDGALRFMALAALLLQPPSTLPKVMVLDEPELGLHPAAISNFAGMVRTASANSQVILATQSPRLVDEFDAEEVVVVEWDDHSIFRRLDTTALSDWLERYSLSELWEKNVLGGRP